MEIKYCWRCGEDLPFLDEDEYNRVWVVHRQCMEDTKMRARENNTKANIDGSFAPVREEFERITGLADFHHNAIHHHRLALLGPDCPQCGKPLRTPRAKLCPECGWRK